MPTNAPARLRPRDPLRSPRAGGDAGRYPPVANPRRKLRRRQHAPNRPTAPARIPGLRPPIIPAASTGSEAERTKHATEDLARVTRHYTVTIYIPKVGTSAKLLIKMRYFGVSS